MYRVRKSWTDAKSQLGAYNNLDNAKRTCDKAGKEYFVFDEEGAIVYPKEETKQEVKVDTSAADPKIIWDFLKKQGLNDYGIAGLMGNLQAESGLRPCNLQNTYEKSLGMTDAEYTAAVDAGTYDNFVQDKAGYGLAQWTYWSRKQNMLNYHKSKNKSIGDLTTQLEFLMKELTTNYTTSVLAVLKSATSVLEASNAVLLKFERPADQSEKVQAQRASFGQKYFDMFGKKEEVKIEIPDEGENGKMKYNENNKPLVCMQTQSTCYKGTRPMEVKGVLWHSTGANNPTLKRYVQPSDDAPDRDEWLELLGVNKYNNDWNHITRQAGLNCWIGKLADGTITTVQTMPWNYRPWGCGSGSKGSCNNGWIQFEICEDGLDDKEYFNKVYTEACEITAYLCDMFDIDPNGTVDYNGVEVPTILCHYDSYKLGLGSNHGDIDHWFPKFGKSMKTVREDVAKLMNKLVVEKPVEKPVETVKSEHEEGDEVMLVKGATYVSDQAIPGWLFDKKLYVRDIRSNGDIVFSTLASGAVTGVTAPKNLVPYKAPVTNTPVKEEVKDFEIGDEVKLTSKATYANGALIPAWVFKKKLYIRSKTRANGDIIISTQKTGAITGVVNKKYLLSYDAFETYTVRVTASVLNVREAPTTKNSRVVAQTQKGNTHTILEVKGDWGRIAEGWLYLPYVKKI